MPAKLNASACGRAVGKFISGLLLAVGMALLLGPSRCRAAVFTDDFAQGVMFTGSLNVQADNLTATAQAGEPAHYGEPAQHSVWLKWSPGLTATYTILVTSNTFDTVVAVYLGNSLTKLKVVATNDDIDFQTTASSVTFRAYVGEVFNIAVDGVGGAQGRFGMKIAYAGQPMAAWTTMDTLGNEVSSQQFTNRFLMLDFWETTCGACVEELYELFRLQHTLGPLGFSFVALALDTDVQTVHDFVLEYPFPYPTIMSSPSAVNSLAGAAGVGPPTKFLVDPERRAVARFVGGQDPVSSTYAFYMGAVSPILRDSSIPQLRMERQGNVLMASWVDSIYPAGFRLESASQLSPGAWSSVSSQLYTNNGRIFTLVPPADTARFFRLVNLNP